MQNSAPRTRSPDRSFAALAIASVVAVAACYSGPDAAHYTAILDEVPVPEGWVEAATVVHGPGGDIDCDPTLGMAECPYVVRYYTSTSTPSDAFEAALTAVAETGFAVERQFDPHCDAQSPACGLTTIRDPDRLDVSVYQPGTDDGAGVAGPGEVTIRLTATDQ